MQSIEVSDTSLLNNSGEFISYLSMISFLIIINEKT